MMRWTLAFALVVLTGCAASRGRPVRAPGELAYRISHPAPAMAQLEILRVRESPAAFSFTTGGTVGRITAELQNGQQVELEVPASGALDLPNDWAALRYRYPIAGADLGRGVAADSDALLPGPAWLLRPRFADPELRATITNHGAPALLPWEPRSEGVWQLSSQELIESGFHALGGRRCPAQGELEIALLGEPHPLGDAAIRAWLRTAAAELLQVRSAFPVRRATVALVPVASDEASPFGRMLPSNPPSFGFLIGSEASSDAFARDGEALHQLLHLVHPAFEPPQPWLADAIATYFTEVARARSGRQTARQAWAELLDGFALGAAEAGGRRTSELGGTQLRATVWAGVHFVLTLDVELRRRGRSLDEVLDAAGRSGTLEQFAAQVDRIAGEKLFTDLLHAHRAARAFSTLQPLLDQLGVHREGVREEAPLAAVRDALMRVKVREDP